MEKESGRDRSEFARAKCPVQTCGICWGLEDDSEPTGVMLVKVAELARRNEVAASIPFDP